ncbi:MAG: hypothetical protein INH13_06405 [Cupriavidus sp.]|nr:hypothetical protein [Cupriavidus sp.]
MTATVHELNITQKMPVDLKDEGVIQHTCGSTSFRMTVPGNVYCAKCGALVQSLQVTDRTT